MAVLFLTLAEGFWVDRPQSVLSRPVRIIITLFTVQTNPDFMVYNTGSKDDWDHISKVTCDPDWTWDAMAKYRDLHQKYVPPNDGHDDVSQVKSAFPSLFLSPFYRRISTSRQRTVAMACYRSVFLATQKLSIRESLQQLANLNLPPSFPSNET